VIVCLARHEKVFDSKIASVKLPVFSHFVSPHKFFRVFDDCGTVSLLCILKRESQAVHHVLSKNLAKPCGIRLSGRRRSDERANGNDEL
jgi:hypothetical protein